MLHIEDAQWLGGHFLRLTFDNGVSKVVDVSPLLQGPILEPPMNENLFAQVVIDPIARTVAWPNGADLAAEALHALKPAENRQEG